MSRRQFLSAGVGLAASWPLLGLAGCGETTAGYSSLPDGGVADAGADGGGIGADAAVDAGPDATVSNFDPRGVAHDGALFPLGVQAGAMREDSALLWGYTQDDLPKRLRVWTDGPTRGEIIIVADVVVTPVDGYMKQAVSGLTGATWYEYGFFAGAGEPFTVRSDIGRFRSAFPAGMVAPITIGATSCTNARNMPYDSLTAMSQFTLDAFLHLGDMVYNDGARTQAEFRTNWRATLQDPGYRAILPHTGMYHTWDDHEITDNSQLYNLDPAVWQTGKDAYFETLAVPRLPGDRLWDSYRWGDTAEFFVLDSRSERDPSTRTTADAIYLSRAQMDWFKQALLDSPCHFKVVLNSVPMIDWPAIWLLGSDRWEGYEAQRDELLDHITGNAIANVWFISGDFHVGAVGRLENGGPRSAYWEILAGPGANGPNPLEITAQAGGAIEEGIYPAAQFAYHSGEFAATIITFDPQANDATVRFLAANGTQVLYEARLTQSL